MRCTHEHARRRAGFTAVELAFCTAILALILGFAAQLGQTGRGAYVAASTKAASELQARRALDRLLGELSTAVAGTLQPVPDELFGTDELVFRQVDRIDAGNVWMGTPVRIRLDCGGNEPCRIVLTRDFGGPGEREIILLRDISEMAEGELPDAEDTNGNGLVDERGFNISMQDGLLTLRITTATPNAGGPALLRSFETSLLLRN